MASELAEKAGGSVDCSAGHVHDYALAMLRSAASEARALPPGEVLPIGLFLERERENKHVSQQIFNKVCSGARHIFHICSGIEAHLCLLPFRLFLTRAPSLGLSCTTSKSRKVAR
jgi:hypothetical protein